MGFHKVPNSFISKLTNYLQSREGQWFDSNFLCKKFNVNVKKVTNSVCVIRDDDKLRTVLHVDSSHVPSRYMWLDRDAKALKLIRGKWLCN